MPQKPWSTNRVWMQKRERSSTATTELATDYNEVTGANVTTA